MSGLSIPSSEFILVQNESIITFHFAAERLISSEQNRLFHMGSCAVDLRPIHPGNARNQIKTRLMNHPCVAQVHLAYTNKKRVYIQHMLPILGNTPFTFYENPPL